MGRLAIAPYDMSRYVGSVCRVLPASVEVNLPRAAAPVGGHYAGYDVAGGQVGEFLVIEGEDHAILCRILEVRLPEKDRLSVEPSSDSEAHPNPLGVAQLLTAVDLSTGRPLKGIPTHPRIAQHVFSAHPLLVKQAIEADDIAEDRKLRLAVFPHAGNTSVSMKPAHVFGRHCAILGATGGGKSWTLARVLEEIVRLGGKAILFDATGEFETQERGVTHVHLGGRPENGADPRRFVSFPYVHLSEGDLFALFRPSMNAQAPRLKEALRSLKIARLQPALAPQGLIRKANAPKAAFELAMRNHAAAVAAAGAGFDVELLSQQIEEECVFPTGRDATTWGNPATNDLAFCSTLMARIQADISSEQLACIFRPGALDPLPGVIDEFLADPNARALRISMEFLPFEHNARELVANAVGRHLLAMARARRFRNQPLVVMLDEAHQFLDKSVGDEGSKVALDSFSLIAKEGRKYFLTCVLATQRPRDIPEDVLSQMGMFIVHRLINERDRNVVEKACGNLDSAAAAFLPTLGQGEAIMIGVDSSMPLPVQVCPPRFEPRSHGPNYETGWAPARP